MLGHLKDVFFTILICLLSATIIPNILEYIQVSLKFSLSSQIYKQLLDCLNLTYIISSIRKTRFKDLDFHIPSRGAIGKIPKTIIFIDKIDNTIQMVKPLQSRLYKCIRRKRHPNHIIRTFTVNLIITSKTKFLADLCSSETRIQIGTECIDMDINLLDICRAI